MKKNNTTIETKRCSKCGRELPISAFGKDHRTDDGHARYCKECLSARVNRRNQIKQANTERGLKRLEAYTDDALYNELRRRGWIGRLVRAEYIGDPAPAGLAKRAGEALGAEVVKTEL